MTRNLTANALAEIAKQYGTQPVNIIGIDWSGEGVEMLYSDKEASNIEGRILELSDLDEIIKVDSGNTSIAISVKLSDTDGVLKALIDTTNIHKKKCTIYQHFTNLALNDRFVLFKGEISSPVIWREGERTLSFEIITKIESKEVGFAPEEGQFKDVSPGAAGQVWPLCFGSVAHVPAVKTSEIRRGNIVTTIGIPDATLPFKRKQLAYNLSYYQQALAYYNDLLVLVYDIARAPITIASDYVNTIAREDALKQEIENYSGVYEEAKKTLDGLLELLDDAPTQAEANAVQNRINQIRSQYNIARNNLANLIPQLSTTQAYKEYLEIEVDNAEYEYEVIGKIREIIGRIIEYASETTFELSKITVAIAQQKYLNQTVFTVVNGNKFPQNTPINLICNGMILSGSFSGDVFTMTAIKPRYTNVKIAPRQSDGGSTTSGTKVTYNTFEPSTLNIFWIEDPTINLAGNYCLLNNGKIVKVTDQIGTKCYFQLEEIRIDSDRKKEYQPAEAHDLTTFLWTAIQNAGCQEHTFKEQQKILENSLGTDQKNALNGLKNRLEKLKELIDDAPTDDDKRAVQTAIYRDTAALEYISANLLYPQKDLAKASQLISTEEFNNLLKLENLHRKEVWRAVQPIIVDIPGIYAVVGPQITGSIAQVAPIILPSWLPYLGSQQLSDLDVIEQLLPNGQSVVTGKLPRTTLWVAEGGSEVVLDTESQEKYICNILPSTIKSVYAYRAVDGFKRLVPLPSTYYTKNENDSYGLYNCTSITLRRPLSSYDDEGWDEGVYVSLVSSVGPNTSNIIKWIIQNYTDLSVDNTTFNSVATALTNYPSHFALLTKQDALTLIESIAWQARCMVWIKFNTVYIRYLAATPTSADTITQSDIEHESLEVSYTPTEDLVTKFVANWKAHYAQEKDNRTIVRYNIPKYGKIEREYDFFIYNIESLVVKSATFWTIRYSNTWKRAKFRTFLTKLKLETLDAVTLNLGDNLIASSSVLGIIESLTYSSSEYGITIDCWLPVRAGEMSSYNFAYPANVNVNTIFPTVADVAAGIAGGDSRVPTGSSFSYTLPHTIDNLQIRPKDYGSVYISDANDSLPGDPLSGYYEVDFQIQKPMDYNLPDQKSVADATTNRSLTAVNKSKYEEKYETWQGRIEQNLQDDIYIVSTPDGLYKQVTELGYVETDKTPEGTRVTVTWNNRAGRYEMLKTKRQNKTNRAQVLSTQRNHLVCHLGGKQILVLKPHNLRGANFDGQPVSGGGIATYTGPSTRTIAVDAYTEFQEIIPPYDNGYVYVLSIPPEVIEGQTYIYIDINADGRSWGSVNG